MKLLLTVLLCCCATLRLVAEERIADIRQGTNLSVTAAPDGTTVVVELLGQLWRVPAAGGGGTALTPPGQRTRHPRYSPDGQRLVYQRLVDGRQWDLWLLDLDSGSQRALTTTPQDEREPDFTTDGASVVFAANRTGRYCLWSITLDGGVETQLTEEDGNASFPDVSELGVIAYVLERSGEAAVRILGTNGASTTVYASAHRLYAPTWRPGGGVLVFGEQDGPQSNRLQMLLLSEPRVLKPLSGNEDVFDTRAAWLSSAEFIYAADGQLWRRGIANPTRRPVHLFAALAVDAHAPPMDLPRLDAAGPQPALGINHLVRSADGRRATFTALGDVWLVERGEPRRLTDDAFVETDPTFWPDGESIVFASERTGQFELWRFELRDDRFTQLTFGALTPHRPAVRPDGQQIAFLETEDSEPRATTRLSVLTWPGGDNTVVATGLVGAGELTWGADGRSLRVQARAVGTVSDAGPILGVELRREVIGPRDGDIGSSPSVQWQPAPAPPAYVVEIGRLFDGVSGDYRRHVDMHVRDGRIAAIVGRGVLPSTGPIIDARDATVIPGFVDVHAHQDTLAGERLGRTWLAYGVTTVREIAADPRAALERSEAWASGRLPGPRLIVTPAHGPSDTVAGARDYPGIANGFSHSLSKQSREIGIPWLSAAPTPPTADATGYELEVSPGFMAYQDGFSRLIASSTVLVPSLGALVGLDGWPEPASHPARRDEAYRMLFTPLEQARWAHRSLGEAALPPLQQTVARLIRGGGRVAVGSDAPLVPYGLGVHLELALLAASGIANDQVLRLATVQGAMALGVEQQIGTLEEGKLADFLVIDGDPLTRLADTLKIVAVAKGGIWHERDALLRHP